MLTRADLRRHFENVDKNNDGLVSIDELQNFLNTIGIQTTKEEVEELVGGQDNLDYDQFLAFHDAINKTYNDDHLREMFNVLDVNGDGLMCAEELQKVLSNMGFLKTEQECKRVIEAYDKNGDGLIDFEEFKVMMSASDHV